MDRVMRLAHGLGWAMFLGSILTFLVISCLVDGASPEQLAIGRRIISTGTNVLTLPGIWVLAVSGILLGCKWYSWRQRFVQLKILIGVLLVMNAYLLVLPAVTAATEIASRSIAEGQVAAAYGVAYMKESISGAVNVLLAVAASVVGVWQIGGRPREEVEGASKDGMGGAS